MRELGRESNARASAFSSIGPPEYILVGATVGPGGPALGAASQSFQHNLRLARLSRIDYPDLPSTFCGLR